MPTEPMQNFSRKALADRLYQRAIQKQHQWSFSTDTGYAQLEALDEVDDNALETVPRAIAYGEWQLLRTLVQQLDDGDNVEWMG